MLNWHLLEDVLGWVAILVLSVVLHFAHWPILDPILSIGFTLFILFNVARNLWVTGKIFFQATPDVNLRREIDLVLREIPNVDDIHHLHLWSLDGEHHVLTVHVVTDQLTGLGHYDQLKSAITNALAPFELTHTTIEIELADESCRDR